MKLLFADLLSDPAVSRRRIWSIVLGDLANVSGGLRVGTLFGFLVVIIWLANRSIDVGARDPGTAVPLGLIALLFVAAGFAGSRRSGTFAGGVVTGFAAGLISALTVPGEHWLFHTFPFYDVKDFVLTYAIASAIVMCLGSIGAVLAIVRGHQPRMDRSAADPELAS
jgi:hypothetical protein